MREIVLAVVALVIISVGANYALKQSGFSAAEQTSGSAVRLSD